MTDYVRVSFGASLKEDIDELHRISQPPHPEVTAALDRVLEQAFAKTQEQVHVITGELKASGHTRTSESGTHWEGEIVYGAPTDGDYGPAYYAIYEMARGGTHDFLRGLEVFNEEFEAALDKHWLRRR